MHPRALEFVLLCFFCLCVCVCPSLAGFSAYVHARVHACVCVCMCCVIFHAIALCVTVINDVDYWQTLVCCIPGGACFLTEAGWTAQYERTLDHCIHFDCKQGSSCRGMFCRNVTTHTSYAHPATPV